MRRLLVTRRHVALDRADDYLTAWADVSAAVSSAGGRAWIFQGAAHEDQFLEFIEWSAETPDVPERDDVAAAIAQLDTYAAAKHADEWEEVK